MNDNELGRVLDPEALASEGGPRGRVRLFVPADWLAGGELELLLPRRLVCDRCDGGGCDRCARSGALRAPADEAARTVCVRLPEAASSGVAIRLAEPFGPEVAIAQVIVELHEGSSPSPGVTRRADAPLPARRALPWPGLALLGLAAAVVIAWLAR